MTKYLVRLRWIEVYEVEVEANSENEAETKAWEVLNAAPDKNIYFYNSDGDVEFVEEVEE